MARSHPLATPLAAADAEHVARTHAADVHRLVARVLVGRPELWDDVAQDALVNVLRGLPGFDPGGAATLRTWVLTVATRTAIDAQRRAARYHSRKAAVADAWGGALSSASAATPEAVAAQRELGRRVARAMEGLPVEQRAALVLRAFHDMDYADIAAATDTTVASVKARLARARKTLEEATHD